MRYIKLSLLAFVLVSFVVGCGGSGKVDTKELSPEQIAEQEAALKQVAAEEAEHRKQSPRQKTSTADRALREAQESERNRRR